MTDTHQVEAPALPGDWTPTRWIAPPMRTLEFEEIERIIDGLRANRKRKEASLSSNLWWLADAMNYGETVLGERFFQMMDERGYGRESLVKVRRMGEEFPGEDRWPPEKISFWTHWEVVPIAARSKRRDLLRGYADDESMSREDLRDKVREILKADEDDGQESLDLGDESGGPELPDCPLCSGVGKITHERREVYFREEAGVYSP